MGPRADADARLEVLRRYTLLAWVLVLFQAFHGLAVTLVYK